jgi:hypothetical protein
VGACHQKFTAGGANLRNLVTMGTSTILRSDGDGLILECIDITRAGIRARIADFLLRHTRRIVIEGSEAIAA